MVVEMKDEPEAYGIYPGGQSGNPGSKYYDGSVDNWSKGQYYQIVEDEEGGRGGQKNSVSNEFQQLK